MEEFLEEVERFKKLLDSIMPKAISNIKCQIIEWHSRSSHYKVTNSIPQVAEVLTTVEGLEVYIWIDYGSVYSFINDNSQTNNKYSLMHSVKTDRGGIHDGKVSWLIWEAIKDEIELSHYPHFNPPIQ